MAEPGIAVSVERQLELRHALGSFVTPNAMAQLSGVAREVFIPAGEVVYREGDTSRHVHFVLEGRVELAAEGEESWFFDSKGVIGIIDAELDRPYSRTARAISDTRMLAVRVEDWQDINEDNFEMTQRSIAGTAEALLRMGLALAPDGGWDAPSSRHPDRPSILVSATPEEEVLHGLNPFERLLTLRLCPLFTRAGTQSLIRVARGSAVREIEDGQLVNDGDRCESLFVVASGVVAIQRREPELAATFGPTDLVGGWAGFGHDFWPVSAAPAGGHSALVLEIRYEDLFDVMEDHFDLVRAVRAYHALEIERLNSLNARHQGA